jgi:adenylyltransferase/sulfurtransferase
MFLFLGRLGLVDSDIVEKHNLHRQILHTEETLGWNKTDSALLNLKRHNSEIIYEVYNFKFTSDASKEKIIEILSKYDIICDCSDSVECRYVLGDYTALLKKPFVAADAVSWEGQCTTYNYMDGPCLRFL